MVLKAAMEKDQRAGKMRDRSYYLELLRSAGHSSSLTSANLIVSREAKRVFGRTLARRKGLSRVKAGGGHTRGRRPSRETELLRNKLASDKASGQLRDGAHYVAWLMDQPGVTRGIRKTRPMVYRELRRIVVKGQPVAN
jgi:hypothetical protein